MTTQTKMNRYWISWREPSADYRPLNFPPSRAVLGWWKSGEGDGFSTLCAAVEAKCVADAAAAILEDWPQALDMGEWRFFELRSPDWTPSDRFPLSEWMVLRFAGAVEGESQ